MHLKVFMKLKKTLKTQKNPKNPKKTKKTPKNHWAGFLKKKNGFFPTLAKIVRKTLIPTVL
jgi:hypothetical protein